MQKVLKRLDLVKMKALLDYLNKLYPNRFGELDICIGRGQTRYRYKYNDSMIDIKDPEIVVGTVSHKEFDEFVIEYYNKTFGLNLKYTPEVRLIQEICHECGHHYNIEYYKDRDEEYMVQLNALERFEEECDERRIAYRQIDEEYDADKFAAQVMKEHLKEMLAIIK